ncbi:toprim domain-containing protein [Neolewinella antarctica]|uniref:DNA primase n=1 Tax=Neolewinella antarctica TaxID=442734 RepID=A0ABX0XDX8_9BACT|nr:toprim domain-containing protein [Neolewinella antarctica]NJC27505.1 DNA primase [Neolewinella antarctica]
MTIPQIKAALPIAAVLSHYGLEAGPTGAMRCPFHADESASMKVYHDTNTAYCFAGSCAVQSVDVIDFIMAKEKGTKRAAILKAKELCGRSLTTEPVSTPKPAASELDLTAIYEESFAGMQRTPSGREYCTLRGLNPEEMQIGYRSRKAKERWGRGCIIFPLVNEGCKVVGLYGRAVKGSGHYYTPDRAGLYPEHPDDTTDTLLLTESVIDAASVLDILDGVTVLALYGTNGLTAAHRLEVKGLKELTEVVLALDGDAAGRKATAAIAAELRALRPGLKVTTLAVPEGEDLNGMWMSYADEDGEWLKELYEARQTVGEETLYI